MADNIETSIEVSNINIAHLQANVKEIKTDVKIIRDMLTNHLINNAQLVERVKKNENEIDTLRRKSDTWNIGNSILAMFAGAVGWLRGG
jgi:spore cortex formation protein SpoVR/YcgB (stage V sporulation)